PSRRESLSRVLVFLSRCYIDHRDLHSFPTRRSSDLKGLRSWHSEFSMTFVSHLRLTIRSTIFQSVSASLPFQTLQTTQWICCVPPISRCIGPSVTVGITITFSLRRYRPRCRSE